MLLSLMSTCPFLNGCFLDFFLLLVGACFLPPLCRFCAATCHRLFRIHTRHKLSWRWLPSVKLDVHWLKFLFDSCITSTPELAWNMQITTNDNSINAQRSTSLASNSNGLHDCSTFWELIVRILRNTYVHPYCRPVSIQIRMGRQVCWFTLSSFCLLKPLIYEGGEARNRSAGRKPQNFKKMPPTNIRKYCVLVLWQFSWSKIVGLQRSFHCTLGYEWLHVANLVVPQFTLACRPNSHCVFKLFCGRDHIYTNNRSRVSNVRIVDSGISDHCAIFCHWSVQVPKTKSERAHNCHFQVI